MEKNRLHDGRINCFPLKVHVPSISVMIGIYEIFVFVEYTNTKHL